MIPKWNRSLGTAVCLLFGLAATPGAALGQAAQCNDPELAGIRYPPRAPSTEPPPLPYERLRVGDVPLGVGHLRPVDEAYVWDWHLRARLPLFASPGPVPDRWLADGWIVPISGDAEPLGTSGMIETGYETPSFIVLQRRDDGWAEIRYAPGGDDGGTAWTHECLWDIGPHRLVFETWQDRLMSADISPLFFLAEVPHSLRAAPSIDSPRAFLIPAAEGDYEIEPLDVRGDWMRVRVTVPSSYCRGPEPFDYEVHEGWVKWRDDEKGPWVWYSTRGC